VTCVAVIPARGGSKRIVHKNIRLFNGRPMVAWSIDVALRSGLFSDVIVSTDDEEIAKVAIAHGASVPFLRPADLSDDHTGTGPVMTHALRWLATQNIPVETACCIYATAPLLESSDLYTGYELLGTGNWSYVIGATDFSAPILRAFKLLSDGGTEMFFPERFNTRSQDMPEAFHDAGQFYWGTNAAWLEGRPGLSVDTTFVKIPRWRVQDIDTEDDWKRAEILMGLINQLNTIGTKQ
jgi:pseudaminic acid cytidylyltransferase